MGPGTLARNGKNFAVRCPFCAPKDHQKRKLVILLEDDRAHCWTCDFKSHTLAPLVKRFGTREQVVEYRDKFMPAQATGRRCLILDLPGEEAPPPMELPKDFKLLATALTRDPDVLALKNYLARRGMTERDLWYFKLGYSNDPRWRRRVLMPSFDAQGVLNCFVGRAIDKFRKPKYDMPEFEKLSVIFNELNIDWTQELVLCEGPFDLVKCPDNTVPLLGSDLNETSALFTAILVHNTPVVLMLDWDMRVKKTPKIARKLVEYDVSVRVARLPQDKDPGDLTRAEVKQLVLTAPPFTWEQAFFDKLEQASIASL